MAVLAHEVDHTLTAEHQHQENERLQFTERQMQEVARGIEYGEGQKEHRRRKRTRGPTRNSGAR